ncbi:DUF58 domain-containing protein [Thiothrix nivea]|uniref:DUF58 domain-containing protein n=1 Tax=Thiothrix nivea (strain ATCC 35100 / DSM 5205 / JP2) TaxID=870187 RepID=A0A656HB25_THINJ|nr:DUF58 domain-containing protein [Thiothrix nivea]EIJ33998.1 protein of unknown function DUF58 [Thiothrix nivea DSM 5205]
MAVPFAGRHTQSKVEGGRGGEGIIFSSLQSLLRLQAQVSTLYLAKKHIRARHAGLHRSVYKGRGMDFAESRMYQPGDDIRTIDWRVTARSGRVHTKVFEEEREKPVLLWLDLRPSMFFATRGRFKSVLAAETAALLLWKTLKDGDRIGGILQNGEHVEFKPSRSRSAALHFLRQLSDMTRIQPLGKNGVVYRGEDLQTSWTRLRRVAQPGSQVFVLSDFRQATPNALRQLAMIARHSQVTLLSIHDPFEETLPQQGNLRLTDGKRNLLLSLGQRLWRDRYTQRATQAAKTLLDFSRGHRIPLVQISTADNDNERLLKLSRGLR